MDSATFSDLYLLKAKMVATEKNVMNVAVNGISLTEMIKGKTTCVRIPWKAGRKIPNAISQACIFLSLLFLIFIAWRIRMITAPITITDIQYRWNSSIVPGRGSLIHPHWLSHKNSACLLLATYTTSKTMKGT